MTLSPQQYPLLYMIIALFGFVIGSFLNVCILRIPAKESIAKGRSHCMSCGYQLKWYDLIPLLSYLIRKGRCRKCNAHISAQYPLVEALNGILYILIFIVNGFNAVSIIYCLLTSALIVLSVIDFRVYEIPVGINLFILVLGLVRMMFDYNNWLNYVIGFLAVSIFLFILYQVTKGRAIGGGDVKLMAVCGLILGWKLIIFAFLMGCILGALIHVIRMKVSKADHMLAMGPYLAAGIFIAAMWGDTLIQMYLHYFNR